MRNIALFYSSNTGNTQKVANKIAKSLDDIKQYNIKVTACEYMLDYENLIFGISTWEDGQMQKEWQNIWDEFKKIDFTNKKVAIFALGDQKKYKNNFVDAMGTLYKQLTKANATILGFTSCLDYNFEKSEATINNSFVGLPLDLENDDEEITNIRIKNWIEQISKEFK
ncbi:flavodoxin [Halarcobacter mediterraneus]|uniref:Flavodoxin n=1 Tax=Halarcobacter mediterraneus TaxID=2023153 RepID=A0A4Q1B250_9BACT|nr:flavodoxin [Halarcobacter mediterraneus]RXK11916.1 flavodoxin [Halarcobacter mediterraneus]|eukprot:gnl/Chilomastix_cuspidata/7444.p1 GENE.gnl/Chilomastix_cuspidata/7444~~gnl/Chilomastix_cuspidata/7444.p1  ORF type:complete len:168 (+),score=20.09 gnl/Chilomastix_cuspidata/7444:41-544(+)